MEVDRNGLEVLPRDECLRLLAGETLGRIGLTLNALPTVLPVNFKLDHDRILIRTGQGTKLDAATRDQVVAFEVDHFDKMSHSGWSVVVTGVAHEITAEAELHELERLPLARWAPRGDGHVLAIEPEIISGRRLHPGSVPPA